MVENRENCSLILLELRGKRQAPLTVSPGLAAARNHLNNDFQSYFKLSASPNTINASHRSAALRHVCRRRADPLSSGVTCLESFGLV